MILQHLYKPILNFIYEKITYRIPEKARIPLIGICFFFIFMAQFLSQYIFLYEGFNRGLRDYIICLMLGIIILVSVNGKLELMKARWYIYIPYILTGLFLLIASFHHDMGPAYQAYPLVMLVAFVCLYFIWANRGDYIRLFKAIATAYVIFAAILMVAAFVLYPFSTSTLNDNLTDYAPFNINPNGVSKIFMPAIACGIFMAISNIKCKCRFLYLIAAGGATGIALLTNCRAGFLEIVAILLIWLVFVFRKANRDMIRTMAITTVLLICFTVAGFVGFRYAADGIHSLVSGDEINKVAKTELSVEEAVKQEKAREVGEDESALRSEMITERIAEGYNMIYDKPILAQLNRLLGGRVSIWAVYVDNTTLSGSDELMFYDTEYAHNQYLELSYKAGALTGIMYLILNIIIGVYLLVMFIKRGRTKSLLLQLMAFVIFFVTSMMDTGILPFERAFIFIYYILMAPLIFKNKEDTLTEGDK